MRRDDGIDQHGSCVSERPTFNVLKTEMAVCAAGFNVSERKRGAWNNCKASGVER